MKPGDLIAVGTGLFLLIEVCAEGRSFKVVHPDLGMIWVPASLCNPASAVV